MNKTILLCILLFFFAIPVRAQEKLAFTIAPPLIKNQVEPGQLWQTSIKVVNNNTEELKFYASARDFTGGGESGTVKFIETDGATTSGRYLSTWIVLESGPYTVPPQKSIDIPFIISVPQAADPGGHYAAILIGTQPPDQADKGASIKVSSLIGSLILLNVAGAVEEKGAIREFSTGRGLYQELPVDFAVRFENKGNVHLLPQGSIAVYDWYGQERGAIDLNHRTDFGSVLPGDVRRYDLLWDADLGFFDQGRYRAQLVLGYGEQAKESADQSLYFWFLDLKALGLALGGLAGLILLAFLMIRLYIRRALRGVAELAKIAPELPPVPPSVEAPARTESAVTAGPAAVPGGWRRFKLAVTAFLILLSLAAAWLYWQSLRPGGQEVLVVPAPAAEKSPAPEAGEASAANTIAPASSTPGRTGSGPVTATTTRDETAAADEAPKLDISSFKVRVENGSGTAGLAGKVADRLRAAGFTVGSTGNADSFDHDSTVIRYPKGAEKMAQAVRDALGKKGEMEELSGTDVLIVVAGKDL